MKLNFMKAVYLIMFVFIASLVVAKQVNLSEIMAKNILDNEDIFMYSPIKMIDSDTNTYWAYNRKGTDELFKTQAFVHFKFASNIIVDKIRVFNGHANNQDLRRVKILGLWAGINNRNENIKKESLKISLLDLSGFQEILLTNAIEVNEINIRVEESYSGSKYDYVCISEIEFWNKHEKYQIANLEEAEKEYVRTYRENLRKSIKGLFLSAADTEFDGTIEVVLGRWRELGIEVEKIDYVINAERKTPEFVLEFKEKIPYEGSVMIKSKYDRMRVDKDGFSHLTKPIVMGKWKIDKKGYIWVKIGNGCWKKSIKTDFKGTDLETVNSVMPLH